MNASAQDGRLYTFGLFRLDPARRLLMRGEAPVAISPTLFDTLLYLVQNPGRIVSKEELLEAVWPSKVVEDSNVSQTIFTLRKALAAAGAAEPYVITHAGRGYRFAQRVRVDDAVASTEAWTASPAGSSARPAAVVSRRPWPVNALASAAVVAATLGVAWFAFWGHVPPNRRLVMVGPFENLTGQPVLDRVFAEATRIELLQSPYLSVLSDQRVRDTLGLMTRPADTPMTPTVSREVCARNNGLALVRGSLAQVGARYLMTLTADDCVSGESLAAEKIEVEGRHDLLSALDRLAGRLRRRLGESSGSVRAFSVPLRQARTASFEALRDYSKARDDADHGRGVEAIPLFQSAIALDPAFAAAHADLAVVYRNLKDTPDSVAQITLAKQAMDGLDARERLFIALQYNVIVTQDADEEIRVLKSWTTLYPEDSSAWANLASALTWNGQAAAAIEPGRRAVSLEPNVEGRYAALARAYLHAGQIDAAWRVFEQARAHKVDGDDMHCIAYQIAFVRRDPAAAAREVTWAKGRAGERTMLIQAAQGAYSLGQVRLGQTLFGRAVALGKPFGLNDFTAAPNARLLYDMGLEDAALQSLARVPPAFDSVDYRFSLAEFGDAARAQTLQQAALARSPTDTLLTQVFAPEVRAALALRARRPAEAVAALRSAAIPSRHPLRTSIALTCAPKVRRWPSRSGTKGRRRPSPAPPRRRGRDGA